MEGGEKKKPCALVGVGRVEIEWAVFCLTLFALLPSRRAASRWILVDCC